MCSFSPLFAENVEGAQTDGISSNVGEKSGEKSCLTSHKPATPDILGVDIEVDTSVNSPLRLCGGGHTSFEIHEGGDSPNIAVGSETGASSSVSVLENAFDVLKEIRIKNVNRIVLEP